MPSVSRPAPAPRPTARLRFGGCLLAPRCRNRKRSETKRRMKMRRFFILLVYPPGFTRLVLFAEDLCGECLHPGSLAPGVRGQARFQTGMRQELFRIPAVFRRPLRQEQPATPAVTHDQ